MHARCKCKSFTDYHENIARFFEEKWYNLIQWCKTEFSLLTEMFVQNPLNERKFHSNLQVPNISVSRKRKGSKKLMDNERGEIFWLTKGSEKYLDCLWLGHPLQLLEDIKKLPAKTFHSSFDAKLEFGDEKISISMKINFHLILSSPVRRILSDGKPLVVKSREKSS